MEKVTLKELGNVLPIGVLALNGDGFIKPFSVRRFGHKDNKLLAGKRDGAVTAGRFASEVLKMFVTEAGGTNLADMKDGERSLFINRLYMADAFALYFGVRIRAKGWTFKPSMICPSCKFRFVDSVNLGSTVVRVLDDPTELERVFTFTEGPYRGKIGEVEFEFDGVTLQPPRWSEIETLSPEKFDNTAEVIEAVVKGAIKRIGDLDETQTRAVLSSGILDGLSLLDFDDLTEDVNNNAPGPEMVIETKCKRCRHPFTSMLDWGYDNFFATSSRSRD